MPPKIIVNWKRPQFALEIKQNKTKKKLQAKQNYQTNMPLLFCFYTEKLKVFSLS